jgi:hypothetical protein
MQSQQTDSSQPTNSSVSSESKWREIQSHLTWDKFDELTEADLKVCIHEIGLKIDAGEATVNELESYQRCIAYLVEFDRARSSRGRVKR